MNYPKQSVLSNVRRMAAMFLLYSVTAGLLPLTRVSAQDLPPASSTNTIVASNSLIIPMDDKQNTESDAGCPGGVNANSNLFNLKAYGLAQRLLQGNIPLMWVIKAGKAKDDKDFTGMAERVFPSAVAAASTDFFGGPFIISAEYVPAATPIINSFRLETERNSPQDAGADQWPANTIEPTQCDDNAASRVRVYRFTQATQIPVRHILTHKPTPVYGAANGGFGGAVHAELFETALITNYGVVNDSTVSASTCSTIATQPHNESATFVDKYRAFVVSGGNLLLQCQSVATFENDATNGHFQTTNGWSTADNNGSLLFPHGDMPFSQFMGSFEDNQEGAVEDWQLAGGSALQNGTFPVVQNANADLTPQLNYTATQSKVGNVGRNGGNVFELGGHNYFRDSSDNVSLHAIQYNGLRMILNALFVPVTRPENCPGISLGLPDVRAFKAVRLGTQPGDDITGNGVPNRGDIIEWTIHYVNVGSAAATNFQITDTVPAKVTYVGTPIPQPIVNTNGAGGTVALPNLLYNGSGNLLDAGAILGVGGRISVRIRTRINLSATGDILNQAVGTAFNLPGNVLSDQVDNSFAQNLPGVAPFSYDGTITQDNLPTVDPTKVNVLAPTAADVAIDGRVVSTLGRGLPRVSLTLFDANTGQTVTASTNSFGYFRFVDLEIGHLYTLNASSKQYQFPDGEVTFTLDDNLSGISIIGYERTSRAPVTNTRTPEATKGEIKSR